MEKLNWRTKIWRNGGLGVRNMEHLTLQEILTVKSDDVAGRVKVYETMVKGEENFESGIQVIQCFGERIKSLALNVDLINI